MSMRIKKLVTGMACVAALTACNMDYHEYNNYNQEYLSQNYDEVIGMLTNIYDQLDYDFGQDYSGGMLASACDEADYDRRADGGKTRGYKLLQGACRRYVYARPVIRLGIALLQSDDRIELPVYLADHALGVPVDTEDEHRGEERRDGRAGEYAEEDLGIHDIKSGDERKPCSLKRGIGF